VFLLPEAIFAGRKRCNGSSLPPCRAALAGQRGGVLAPVLRPDLQVRGILFGISLKRLDFLEGLARLFTMIPAESAGFARRVCRAEGKQCH